MNHTWTHRFKTAIHNKNWKKITLHELVEYAWVGSWVTYWMGSWEGWLIGLTGAFVIHMIVFEAIDALYSKKALQRKKSGSRS